MGRILPLVLALLLRTGCTGPQPVEAGAFLLDTYVSIRIYGGDEDTVQGALELCRQYEAIFSRTDPDSELCRLNRREIAAVSPALAEVVSRGLAIGQLTDGAFDITMGSVTRLWDFHG